MIKQNKGKDLHKVPKSKMPSGPFYVSKKYDGHYVQVKKSGNKIQFFTSGGKEFYLGDMAMYLQDRYRGINFHVECEYNHNCYGRLGDRGKSAIITTYRTNYNKGIRTAGKPDRDIFRVLDILDMSEGYEFRDRFKHIMAVFYGAEWFTVPHQLIVQTIEGAQDLAKQWVKEGYEGAMLKSPAHIYQPGKRTNDIIKIKPRLTADLLCIAWKEGEGKYEGMIGALLLRDLEGREVWAGSGLNDSQRELPALKFLRHVVEIEYERIDETYIQPIIKHIRYDKTEEEID